MSFLKDFGTNWFSTGWSFPTLGECVWIQERGGVGDSRGCRGARVQAVLDGGGLSAVEFPWLLAKPGGCMSRREQNKLCEPRAA